jgi:hypothetical protein
MKHLAMLGLALILALPAQAQVPKTTLVTRLFETVATYAPPPWVKGLDDMAAAEVSRNQGKTGNGTEAFILEFVPRGESFDNWSQLYAIMAETPLKEPLKSYRNGVVEGFYGACSGNPEMQSVASSKQVQIFVVFCPAYRSNPALGEIMIMAMRRHGGTMVKNYYHRRAAAFRMDSPESWPLSRAQIAAVVGQLKKFSLAAP